MDRKPISYYHPTRRPATASRWSMYVVLINVEIFERIVHKMPYLLAELVRKAYLSLKEANFILPLCPS